MYDFFNGKKCESLILKSLFFRKNWKSEHISMIFTAVWKAYKLTPTGWKRCALTPKLNSSRNLLCHSCGYRPLASRESAAHSQSQEQVPPKTEVFFLTVISPGNASLLCFLLSAAMWPLKPPLFSWFFSSLALHTVHTRQNEKPDNPTWPPSTPAHSLEGLQVSSLQMVTLSNKIFTPCYHFAKQTSDVLDKST